MPLPTTPGGYHIATSHMSDPTVSCLQRQSVYANREKESRISPLQSVGPTEMLVLFISRSFLRGLQLTRGQWGSCSLSFPRGGAGLPLSYYTH